MFAIPVLASRSPQTSVTFWEKLGASFVFVTDDQRYGGVQWRGLEFHYYQTDETRLLENSLFRVNVDSQSTLDELYDFLLLQNVVHPNGHPEVKPYGYKEFSILDPFGILITFALRLP